MATRSNRYFNNPAFAQVASNLAGMFSPPSASDTYAYEKAASERQEAQRLAQLWKAAGDDFDRMGVASGQWNPNQSYYAVNTADATTRRGQDIASGDRRYGTDRTYDATVRGQNLDFAGDRFNTPLAPGETMPGMVDDEIALIESMGLDVPTDYLPGRSGVPKPMSSDEVTAMMMQDLIEQDSQYGTDIARNELDATKTVDENGNPIHVPTGRAAAEGLPAYVDQGSQASMDYVTYRTPDGKTGTAVLDPAGGPPRDATSGAALPEGTITGEVTDTSGAGLTTSTTSSHQKAKADVDMALGTAYQLRDLIASAPGTGGLVGMARSTVQDLIATGGEVGQLMNEMLGEADRDIASGYVQDENLAAYLRDNAFDPNIPARQALTVLLSYQIAKANTPGRVSNEAVRRIQKGLGESGMLANQQRSLAALDAYIREFERRSEQYGGLLGQGRNQQQPGGQAPQSPPVGTVEDGHEFLGGDPRDPANWRAVQ